MSEDLPKGEERGKAVARRRWGLYIQVIAILLLLGAGIGLALRESTLSDAPEGKVRAIVAELERQESHDLLPELEREFFPKYGKGRYWPDVADDLAALGVEAAPDIIVAAGHELTSVRRAAARALGKIGDRRAFAPLADMLARDSDSGVREVAACALGKLGGPEATARLIEAMADSKSGVRREVAGALGRVGGPEATARLIEAIIDPDAEVRGTAALALGEVGGPEATARLIESMADSEPKVRCLVARALGQVGGPEATTRLIEAMADSELNVREIARESLQQIRQAGQSQTPSAPPQN